MKSNLNDKQREAVNLGFGPALILAGPGSGKTTVILERIKHLIYDLDISPKEILVITFTKAAAMEMETRATKILKGQTESPFFGTFHSYFYSVLRRSYEYRNFSISTDKQKYKNLQSLLHIYYPNISASISFMQDVFSCISKYKNDMEVAKEVEKLGFTKAEFIELCKKYDYFNREQKRMDYDDIILFSLELLKNNEVLLNTLQKEIGHILVDEFQDVNRKQYELISLVARKGGNIFVVGDDDQSIYKFRGAGNNILASFEKDFYSANKVILNVNYRCPKEIVKCSSLLINHNENRFSKKLQSGKCDKGEIVCKKFLSKDKERAYVVNIIKQLSTTNEKVALLCRTNSQLYVFSQLLKKEKIKFYKKEKKVNFYESPYIKNIVGYMLFATGVDRSLEVLFSFLNKPMRYLERELFVDWDLGKRELDNVVTHSQKSQESLRKLNDILNCLSKLPPKMAIAYILKVIGYEEYVKAKCSEKQELALFYQYIDMLNERASDYKNLRQWMESVVWEKNIDLHEMTQDVQVEEMISLHTFHSAKGLEFENVIIPHLNEGSVPYGKKLTKEELEEERRMFYVALTRSSKNLYITYVDSDTKKDTASTFLKECKLTASKH